MGIGILGKVYRRVCLRYSHISTRNMLNAMDYKLRWGFTHDKKATAKIREPALIRSSGCQWSYDIEMIVI